MQFYNANLKYNFKKQIQKRRFKMHIKHANCKCKFKMQIRKTIGEPMGKSSSGGTNRGGAFTRLRTSGAPTGPELGEPTGVANIAAPL